VNHRVPLARRNLFQDRRRALLSISGVAASLVLVLVLNGVFAGAMRQVTDYIDHSPADVFVSQAGVRTMHMSVTSLPPDIVGRVRSVDGVAWAEPLRYTTSVVAKGDASQISYVLGYDPTSGRAGPRALAEGVPPDTGRVLVDQVAASELGVQIGDIVQVLGSPLRVFGFSIGGTNLVNTTVYITADDFSRLRGPGVNYVLVGAGHGIDGGELARRIEAAAPGTTVQTRREFSQQESRIIRYMAADVMSVMTVIGFLIALAVVALTLFTLTLAKLRGYGILNALGATSWRLVSTVATQTIWTVALGVALAVLVTIALGAAIGGLTANVRVVVEPGSVARVSLGALMAGAVAALVPLSRVLGVDPSSALRSPS
jgi:putative ABC transport system permease protein